MKIWNCKKWKITKIVSIHKKSNIQQYLTQNLKIGKSNNLVLGTIKPKGLNRIKSPMSVGGEP
jgi:hypothetical protein